MESRTVHPRLDESIMLVRTLSPVTLALSISFASCAGGPPPETPAPLQHWIGLSLDTVEARLGPSARVDPSTIIGAIARYQGEAQAFVWRRGSNCRLEMYTHPTRVVQKARIMGDCPPAERLFALGWMQSPRTAGLNADYRRFFEVYRVWTDAVRVGVPSSMELSFVAGFHKDNPHEVVAIAVIRSLHQERRHDPVEQDPTDIPASRFQTGQARFLLNNEDVVPVQAIREIPLNLVADDGDYLVLTLPVSLLHQIGRAQTVEVLLPSRAEIELPPEYLEYVGNLASTIVWPDAVRELVEESRAVPLSAGQDAVGWQRCACPCL